MQFVEGETLAARLKQGRLSPDEALDVVSQVADALAAAHRQGVVHRDIKPQNIMLTSRGGLKVLDFGLAKRAPSGPASEEMTLSTVGQSGRVVGTAPYMSPEQVKQESVDGRSDLFALGATYYECLTGRRAFSGKSPLEICGQVLHVEPPPPSSINDQLGPAHDELCRQLLAKRPDDRVQTGEEALRLLELARQIGTVTVRHTTPQPRGWTGPRLDGGAVPRNAAAPVSCGVGRRVLDARPGRVLVATLVEHCAHRHRTGGVASSRLRVGHGAEVRGRDAAGRGRPGGPGSD